MTLVLFSIALTTGACAFMFFLLPYLDSRKSNSDEQANKTSNRGG